MISGLFCWQATGMIGEALKDIASVCHLPAKTVSAPYLLSIKGTLYGETTGQVRTGYLATTDNISFQAR